MLFFKKKLHSLRASGQIRTRFYVIFIESVLIYHVYTRYSHMCNICQYDFNHVIHLANSVADCDFPSLSAVCLRM